VCSVHGVRCEVPPPLSTFQRPFSKWTWISRHQNVSILDFLGAKDGGGGETCSQIIITNKPTPSFSQAGCPFCRPANSVRALKRKSGVKPAVCEMTLAPDAVYICVYLINSSSSQLCLALFR